MTTLSELITVDDSDEVLTFMLTQLAERGFPTTAWATGSVVYSILKVESLTIADKLALIASIARGGLLDLSTGGWLDLLAASAYDLERDEAQFTSGTVRISCAAGLGPHNLSAGAGWIVATSSGLRFNSTNSGTVVIPSGGYVDVTFRAEHAGASYNLAIGAALRLATPALPGVTAAFTDSGSGNWLTEQGTDGETDVDLRLRCRSRWASIGLQKTIDAYVFLATATPDVATRPTRVYVDATNPRGPATLDVWIAGPAGPVSVGDETLVRAWLEARKSPATDLQTENATALDVDVVADIYYDAAFPNAVAEAEAAVIAVINAATIHGTIYYSEILAALTSPDGVLNATLTGFVDVTAAVSEVAVPGTLTLTGHAT